VPTRKSAPTLEQLTARMAVLQPKLKRRQVTLAVAESCTGGLLSAVLSANAGASNVFNGGGVVYSDEAKTVLADVPPQLIASHGAVSSVVAGALARGARTRLRAKVGLGITGIAGPGGATPGKPVGLTYVAIDSDAHSAVRKYVWTFDRTGNRLASVGAALDLLEELVG
jgi:PncC family amidohydrolase